MFRHRMIPLRVAAQLCALAAVALGPLATLPASATDAAEWSAPASVNPRHDPDARAWRHGYTSQPDILRPRHVERIVCDQGWTDPHSIRFDRRTGHYTAFAYGPRGRPFQLTINAHSGRVLAATPIGRWRSHHHPGW